MGFCEDVKLIIGEAVAKMGTAEALANATGIKGSSISVWRNKGVSPHVAQVAPIIELMGYSLRNGSSRMVSPPMKGGDSGLYAFDKSLRSSFDNCFFVRAKGTAMEPLISDGDIVLVDGSSQAVADGHVFLFQLGEDLLIRRAYRTVEGWLFRAGNHNFPDIAVSEKGQVEILGEVVWRGSFRMG